MLRRGLNVAIAIVLAACGDGIFIEVDTSLVPASVERVEIITSKKLCALPFAPDVKCNHMQGEGFDRAFGRVGDIFTRHRSAEVSVDADGLATFELEPGFGVLPMAFAIARDGQGTPVGVAAMEDTIDTDAGSILYRVTLDPAHDFILNPRDERVAGVKEWGIDTGRDCIGLEPISPDPARGKVFIVPEANPDCDSMHDPDECEPLSFNGFSIDEGAQRHCVVRTQRVDPAPGETTRPCVLGHLPVCNEKPTPEEPCFEQTDSPPLCLPSLLCDPNNAVCPDPQDDTCQQTALLGGSIDVNPSVVCAAPAIDDVGGLTPCLEPKMGIMRPTALVAPAKCTDVRLTGTDLPFHAQRQDRVTANGATFKIEGFEDDCTIHLAWTGQIANGTTVHSTLVLAIDNGMETRELMFPIAFEPTVGCEAAGIESPCVALPVGPATDAIFSCLL